MPTREDTSPEQAEDVDLIEEFTEHLIDLGRAEATIETYVGALRQADAYLAEGLNCTDEPELKKWLRTPGWSKATVRLRTTILKTYYTFACDPRRSPRLDFNPSTYLASIRLPRRQPRPAPTEVLTDALHRLHGDHRLILILAAYAGARCVEVAALDREDITEESITLHGKGDTTRVLPVHPRIWAEMQQRPAGPLLRDAAGRRLTRRQVSRKLNLALDRIGHDTITAHRFRHWFGTEAHNAVPDLRAVQELLGHSSPATTQIYVAVNQQRMAAAVAGLPTFTE